MSLAEDRTLAHYRITAAIGAGGMGEVYRATDTKLGRDVALKVLPAELASRPERLERFRREAKALAALDHPGIVTVFSVEEADGVQFLTMQLVEGQPLDRVIPEAGLPVDRILEIAMALAEALADATCGQGDRRTRRTRRRAPPSRAPPCMRSHRQSSSRMRYLGLDAFRDHPRVRVRASAMAAPRASYGAGRVPPVKVVDAAGGASVGLTFNLSEPDKKIVVGETAVQFPAQPVADLMCRRFGRAVDVVAVLHLSKGIEVSAGAGRTRRRSRPRPR